MTNQYVQEYGLGGFLKGLGSIAAGLAGGALLGPWGAALGSALYTGLTERDVKKGILSGLTAYVGGKAFQGLGQAADARNALMAGKAKKMGLDAVSGSLSDAAPWNQAVGGIRSLGFRGAGNAIANSLSSRSNIAFLYPQMGNLARSIEMDRARGTHMDPYVGEPADARARFRRRHGERPFASLYGYRSGAIVQPYALGGRLLPKKYGMGLLPDVPSVPSVYGDEYVPAVGGGKRKPEHEAYIDPLDEGSGSPLPPSPPPVVHEDLDKPKPYHEEYIPDPGNPYFNPDLDNGNDFPYEPPVPPPDEEDLQDYIDERLEDIKPKDLIGGVRARSIPADFIPGRMPEFNYFMPEGGDSWSLPSITPTGINPFNMTDIDALLSQTPDMLASISDRFVTQQRRGGMVEPMADGGEVASQVDTELVNAAVAALLGQVPPDQAEKILQKFVAKYGPESLEELKRMVSSEQANMPKAEGMLEGPGAGMDDMIPASVMGSNPVALSAGEFIIPADVVSMIGDGNSSAGADRLQQMTNTVRQQKTGSAQQAPPLDQGLLSLV